MGGDQCTKFFHILVSQSTMGRSIESLNVNGQLVSDKETVSKSIRDFYMDLYNDLCPSKPFPRNLNLNRLDAEQADNLESTFSESEVYQAVCDLSSDKSPGSDGFPLRFYKSFWEVMKIDLMRVVENFYRSSYLDWRLNTTFISLIPKEPGASSLNDFRPISLLSGCYKIIAKILANWLKPVLSILVSELQGSSAVGRQIQDLSLIANELLDSRLTLKQGGILFKVDFFKAFDSVSWQFLDAMLEDFGFGKNGEIGSLPVGRRRLLQFSLMVLQEKILKAQGVFGKGTRSHP